MIKEPGLREFGVSAKSCLYRLERLVKKFKAKDRIAMNASGGDDEELSEKDSLLTDLLSMKESYVTKKTEKKKH